MFGYGKAYINKLILLLLTSCLFASGFIGCKSQLYRVSMKGPEEIREWSDTILCQHAAYPNNAIKKELLKRGLMTETELEYLDKGEHQYIPVIGMNRCSMLAFSEPIDVQMLKKTVGESGATIEYWKVHQGSWLFYKSFAPSATGAYHLLITIENDKITKISEEQY